jgi:hypothetical protein
MEARAMERFRAFIEGDAIILAIMALFTFLKQSINEPGPIHWAKAFTKVFTNFVAGWGFFSLVMAYDARLGEYPQKVGVIMITVYAGSRLIDIVVDGLYRLNFKEIIRRWMGL